MRIRLVLLLMFCSWLCMAEPEQSFAFRTIRQEQGLSHNGVKSLFVDSRGYVWIGTQMGLNRFDGTRTRSYYHDDLGLSSNYISAICEDHNGNIWIGTSCGISVYNYPNDYFWIPSGGDNGLNKCFISSIVCNSKGEIWVSTNKGGLFRYDASKKVFVKEDVDLGCGSVRLGLDSEDNLLIASSTVNLFKYTGQDCFTVNPANYPNVFAHDEIWGPVSRTDVRGLIYVSTKKHGVFEVDLRRNKAKHLLDWELDEKPTGLSLENNKILWCATSSGIVRIELGTGHVQRMRHSDNDPFSISEDYLCCIATDIIGNVWVGTSRNGVSFYNKEMNRFDIHFRTDKGESLNNCVIRDFTEDLSGIVWIATERMGLLRFNPREKRLERYNVPGIPQFLCGVKSEDNLLWIGTQYGLLKYNLNTRRIYNYMSENIANENRVTSLFIASDKQLYVGLLNGVWKYDAKSDSFIQIPGLENVSAGSFVEDRKGNIWLSTYSNGVFKLSVDDGKLTSFLGKTQPMTSSVFLDRYGYIWVIGYDSEISRYDEASGDFMKISFRDDSILPNSVILCAEQGTDGHIWISTTSGLVDFDTSSFTTNAIYDKRSGLLENDFSQSSIILKDGTCLFGSINGFISFSSNMVVQSKQSVDVDALLIGDEEIHPGKEKPVIDCNVNIADDIHIESDKHLFSVRLSTPGMLGPAIVSYQMVGYNKAPIRVCSDAQLNFYDVPPGTYSLEISGHKPIKVTVDPPFFLSTLGICVLIASFLLLVLLLMALLNLRQRTIRKKRENDFKMEQEAEVIKDKMNFLSNVVHEIKTPLTLIKTPLHNISSSDVLTGELKKDVEIIRNGTASLDKLSNDLLEYVQAEGIGYVLSLEPIDLIESISFMCYNFSETAKNNNIKIEFIHTDEQVYVNADDKAIRKIINNLLHNSLKYAKSYFAVEVVVNGKTAYVKVRNDGPVIPEARKEDIFRPFVQLKDKSYAYDQCLGIGLALARRLAVIQGGSLYLSSSAETEFVFTIPIVEHSPRRFVAETTPADLSNDGNPVILIIENDEKLSEYLKEKLSAVFNPITATSAKRGLNILKLVNVDLILTDIGMSGMKGGELCRLIKEDPDNSNLPVIVISAVASETVKIECIENGADIYIEKPFTIDYLIASINNLLRKSQSGTKSLDMQPVRIMVEDRDSKFLSNLNAVIESHISDESFTVKQLEEELFLSHSSLNRKMATLLNTTPVDYIRTSRLKTAASILKSKDVNVSELCYMVGFSTRQYFYKCFKDYFGVAPSEYAKNNKN